MAGNQLMNIGHKCFHVKLWVTSNSWPTRFNAKLEIALILGCQITLGGHSWRTTLELGIYWTYILTSLLSPGPLRSQNLQFPPLHLHQKRWWESTTIWHLSSLAKNTILLRWMNEEWRKRDFFREGGSPENDSHSVFIDLVFGLVSFACADKDEDIIVWIQAT